MFCILFNSPFSHFESKIFNISRRIEDVSPQSLSLIVFSQKKNEKKKKKKFFHKR